jgi:hypothetical protein
VQEQDIAGASQRFDLPREHLLKAEVIGRRCQQRRVRGERNGSDGTTRAPESYDILGGEVLRVGSGSAVATEEQLATILHGPQHQISDSGGRLTELGTDALCDSSQFGHVPLDGGTSCGAHGDPASASRS